MPDQHSRHFPEPAIPLPVWYVPARHNKHTSDAVMPVPVWYVPAWHGEQASGLGMPVPVWYVPAWHSVQLMMLETARPVEYVPELQAEHVCGTESNVWTDGLYFPDGHASQFIPDQLAGGVIWPVINGIVEFQPPIPVNPALHLQAD